ncbi:ankyrin-1-like [Branchiostoma lanceolatum]|uniref:ankyrin-1-like n=1 Tax=Branchiostoma lanceolatum TaxID=7740 RepID=UPI0034538E6C
MSETELEVELVFAADSGDVEKVARLLQQGVDVNCSRYIDTPLHYAASRGHVGVAELLLKAGAQVDSRDGSEDTPLHLAASGGHVGVVELLLKAGAQVDSRDRGDRTPKDMVESTDVPWYSLPVKQRILEGRKKILEIFATVMAVGPFRRKVGPEGGELQTESCTLTVPRGAVAMETEITCQVINPNDVTLPLEDGAMLVSDVIELGPHGTTFHQPVTVQMQYSSGSSGGAREPVVWVTKDRSQWTKLPTRKKDGDRVSVSVDHFSTFAVVSRPKQDQFTVPTGECTLTSSTQPAVQISFPEEAVSTPTHVTIQVQEVPKTAVEDMKVKDQSSRGLVSTSPIVNVETVSDSEVQFLKPVTVRVPHPQHYMDIQHEGETKLRVMSCEEGTEDWVDETDNTKIRVTDEFVEFEVSHFTRWIVIVVTDKYDDPKEFEPIPLKLCRWLQHRAVQFILVQREDNANEFVIECATKEDTEKKHAALLGKGYKGPVPTDSVDLFEGQIVEISLLGNVSIAAFGSSAKQQITFHSQKDNRLHMQVMALEARGQMGLDGKGRAAFFALPRVKVAKEEKRKVKATLVRKRRQEWGHPPGEAFQEPTLLCQLPIHVPYETPKLIAEQAASTSKGVERCFYFIKENVSIDWIDLAIHLGIKGADIRNIAGRNPDDKSRCFDLLWEWQKREGDAATAEVLMEALSEAELQSVVDGMRNKFPDIVAEKPRVGDTSKCSQRNLQDKTQLSCLKYM